jgi:two-component system response regulator AtoC
LSPRRDMSFVEVNCAAIPENLFESELFGHEKGAFTGAVSRRKGKFEIAQGGTLFLDEIGELPVTLQPKLLRALQEKRIGRVGSEREIEVDVRVIVATNKDLKRMAEDGTFREDLYYRVNVFEIEIPPLRWRREDIADLLDFFLERHATRPVRFSPEARDMLIKYPYPGNVRELEHLIQRTVTLVRGTVIERLDSVERDMLLSALEKSEWVQTRAAEILGVSERVLRYKMNKHGIKR